MNNKIEAEKILNYIDSDRFCIGKEQDTIQLTKPDIINISLDNLIYGTSLLVNNISRSNLNKTNYKYVEFSLNTEAFLQITGNNNAYTLNIIKRTYLYDIPLSTLLIETKNKYVINYTNSCDYFISLSGLLETYLKLCDRY